MKHNELTKEEHDTKKNSLIKKRRNKVEQYWADRAQSRVRANDHHADMVKREQDLAYKTARENVQRDIDKFYRDFGNAAGMSEEEVRQKLSRSELKDFKAELERKRKIIQEMIAKDPNNKALKRYDRDMSTCTPGFDYTDIRPEDIELDQWLVDNIPEAGNKASERQLARTQAQWDAYVRMLKEHLLAFKAQAKSAEDIRYGAFHESHRLCEFDDDGNLVPEWRPYRLN